MRAGSGNKIDRANVLMTNGNVWQMIQIKANGEFEKTCIYEPNDAYKKIYRD